MAKTPPIIYILHGEDSQGIDEFLDQIRARLGDAATAEMNTTRLESRGLTMALLRNACLTAPFLARRRLVLLEGQLSALSTRGPRRPQGGDESEPEETNGEGGGKAAQRDFADFLAEVPASTALMLVERRRLPPAHFALKWAAAHPDVSYVREFNPPAAAELPQWILARAKSAGGEFTPPAAQMLAALAGEDPRILGQEILKLITYANFSRPVTPEDVRALTPESAQTNIFDMVDAVGGRETDRALQLLHRTLEQEGGPAVFGMVVRQFRLLILAREALDGGIAERNLASAIGQHPFVARKLAGQARNFTLPVLERIFRRLRDIDEEAKTGRTELSVALETMVYEMGK
jgi:DNA polymerase-3 subunit delta